MYEESHGTITVAQNVLNTIARLTTLRVDGVARMGNSGRLLRPNDGVNVELVNGRVKAEIYIQARSEMNMFEIGQNIQHEVARSFKEIVGLDVESVNVHIQGVAYATPPAEEKQP
jgi:uncharacterized alkaline shock family protein YloU